MDKSITRHIAVWTFAGVPAQQGGNMIELQELGSSAEGEGARLVSAVEQLFERHLVVPPGVPLVLSLYAMLTYLWEFVDFVPYLSVTSPVMRCGKTTLAQLLEWLVCRPLYTVDATGPSTFRLIEEYRPTLIFDEAERYLADRSVRALINAGYKKGAAIPRVVAGTVELFKVYGPKVYCVIGDVPDTVRDRSILICMRRAKKNEWVEELRERTVRPIAAQLAEDIVQWIAANRDLVVNHYGRDFISFRADREANLWSPLFAIAAVAVPGRLAELKAIAIRLITDKAKLDCEVQAVQLLTDLRTIFASERIEQIPTTWLLSALHSSAESTWKKLSGPQLAHILRPFDIAPKQMWVAGRNVRGYLRQDFVDAFERYLPVVDDAGSETEGRAA
jgi:hypothetical protein